MGLQLAQEGQAALHHPARRLRLPAVRRLRARGRPCGLGGGGRADPGVVGDRHRHPGRRRARARAASSSRSPVSRRSSSRPSTRSARRTTAPTSCSTTATSGCGRARQHAIMRVRSELEQAIRDFFDARGFTLIDSPILTPAACEGTSTLFETDYFGDEPRPTSRSPASSTSSRRPRRSARSTASGRPSAPRSPRPAATSPSSGWSSPRSR